MAGSTGETSAASTSGGDEVLDRVLTIPNGISVVRLACIPVFLWLLFGRDDRASAAWLLAGLGATDWIDGYIARRWHQVSSVGKILDPTADRLLFIVGVTAIIIDNSAPRWLAIAVVVREVSLSIALVTLTAFGMARFDVSWFGKAGTFGLMVAFPLFMISNADVFWSDQARVAAWLSVIPALALSYYAAVLYIPQMRDALRDGRAARRETSS